MKNEMSKEEVQIELIRKISKLNKEEKLTALDYVQKLIDSQQNPLPS